MERLTIDVCAGRDPALEDFLPFALGVGFPDVPNGDWLREVEELIAEVEGQGCVVATVDDDGVALNLCVDALATLQLVGRRREPVEVGTQDGFLLPDDVSGPRLPPVLRHPRQGRGILAIHPMSLALYDVGLMDVASGVCAL